MKEIFNYMTDARESFDNEWIFGYHFSQYLQIWMVT